MKRRLAAPPQIKEPHVQDASHRQLNFGYQCLFEACKESIFLQTADYKPGAPVSDNHYCFTVGTIFAHLY